jgi:sugar/nucleoside kinase (ribokinase family)
MTATRHADVLVTGLNIVDILARLPEKIHPGEKHEIHDLLVQGGAPASNAASVIAALGWRTGFIARMGNNTLSDIARVELTRHGVLEDFFINDPEALPGVSLVEIDPRTGDRTVFYTLNGYHSLTRADIPVEAVKRAKLILVDGYQAEAGLAMLEAAQGTHCRSVIDIEAGEPDILRKLIELATDAILPLGAARRLSGETDPVATIKKISSWTRAQLIVTDGVNGSWAITSQGIVHQPSFKVNVVDTTGCGDAYHGAYASALLDGLPLPQRMEFSSWVAAQVALKLGGRSNIPTRDSIRSADLSLLSPELKKHLQS